MLLHILPVNLSIPMKVAIFGLGAMIIACIFGISFSAVHAAEEIDSVQVPKSTYTEQIQKASNIYHEKKTAFQLWYTANNKRVTLIPDLMNVRILDFLLLCLAIATLAWVCIRWLI
jgi:hypothetical protein